VAVVKILSKIISIKMDDLILSDFGNEKIIGPNIKNANILLFIGNIYVMKVIQIK